jgi:hypothetical protein
LKGKTRRACAPSPVSHADRGETLASAARDLVSWNGPTPVSPRETANLNQVTLYHNYAVTVKTRFEFLYIFIGFTGRTAPEFRRKAGPTIAEFLDGVVWRA